MWMSGKQMKESDPVTCPTCGGKYKNVWSYVNHCRQAHNQSQEESLTSLYATPAPEDVGQGKTREEKMKECEDKVKEAAKKVKPEDIVPLPFQIGDLVHLKSGGPEMTVLNMGGPSNTDSIEMVECGYFPADRDHMTRLDLPPEALLLVVSE